MNQKQKIDKEQFKKSFTSAVKDKRRWLMCLLELAIVALLIVADMLTKKYIYGYCDKNHNINIITNVLSFTAVKNTGAGFGLLQGQTQALTVISAICSVILLILIFYSYPRKNKVLRSSLVLICAGAIGNIIDRMFLGYVRDFIYFEPINFPVFNFADSCLTIGTVLLIIYILFFYNQEEKTIEDAKKAAAKALDTTKQVEDAPSKDNE